MEWDHSLSKVEILTKANKIGLEELRIYEVQSPFNIGVSSKYFLTDDLFYTSFLRLIFTSASDEIIVRESEKSNCGESEKSTKAIKLES